MAANTNMVFSLTGPSVAGVAVGLVTNVSAGTGATTVFTVGANGGPVDAVEFNIAEPGSVANGQLLVYANNILKGVINITDTWQFGDPPKFWHNPFPQRIQTASLVWTVGKLGAAVVIHATGHTDNL